MFTMGGLLGILENVGVAILAGAAGQETSIGSMTADHPVVALAAEAGAVAAQTLGKSVPVSQIATAGLMLAQLFAQHAAPAPAAPAPASGG